MDSAKFFTLACLAYGERQFEDAGRFFAAAMDSDNFEDLMEVLCDSMDIDYESIQKEVDTMISEANSFPSLSEIAESLSDGMKDEYVSVGKGDDEEESESESNKTESTEETDDGEQESDSGDKVEQETIDDGSCETNSSQVEEENIETSSSELELEVKSCIKIS